MLQDQLNQLHNQGKRTVLKYDKIEILENDNEKGTLFNNKKRNLTESPEFFSHNSLTAINLNKPMTKKNKVTSIKEFMSHRHKSRTIASPPNIAQNVGK